MSQIYPWDRGTDFAVESEYNVVMTTNRIMVDPKIYGGKPCIRGTRITVTMILELIEDGLTFQQIIDGYYPQLSEQDIKACLEYARAVVEGEDIYFQ